MQNLMEGNLEISKIKFGIFSFMLEVANLDNPPHKIVSHSARQYPFRMKWA